MQPIPHQMIVDPAGEPYPFLQWGACSCKNLRAPRFESTRVALLETLLDVLAAHGVRWNATRETLLESKDPILFDLPRVFIPSNQGQFLIWDWGKWVQSRGVFYGH